MLGPKQIKLTGKYAICALAFLSTYACSQAESNVPTDTAEVSAPKAQPAANSTTKVSTPDTEPSFNELVAKKGKRLYIRCAACHSKTEAEGNKVGPHLEDIVGRKIATVDGFTYSKELSSQDGVWDEELLNKWIEKPRSVFPKTSMAFAGIPKESDRKILIEYMKGF